MAKFPYQYCNISGIPTIKTQTVVVSDTAVTFPRPRFNTQNTFGQIPETVVDIVANVNGERREFKQVPSNNAIADFGPDTFVLSDTKDSLMNYVSSMLQNSRNIVNSVDKHRALISQYEHVLGELNPNVANDNAVKELKGEVADMREQLAEALALLREKA